MTPDQDAALTAYLTEWADMLALDEIGTVTFRFRDGDLDSTGR